MLQVPFDGLSDFVLNSKNVFHTQIVAFRPDFISVGRIDELRTDPQSLTGSAHAPFQDLIDTQPGRKNFDVEILSSHGKRRSARSNANTSQLSQSINELFRDAVAEVFLVSFRTQIRKGQYGNPWTSLLDRARTK